VFSGGVIGIGLNSVEGGIISGVSPEIFGFLFEKGGGEKCEGIFCGGSWNCILFGRGRYES
jgi:hypothetical protein